jgi:hypothetical protein
MLEGREIDGDRTARLGPPCTCFILARVSYVPSVSYAFAHQLAIACTSIDPCSQRPFSSVLSWVFPCSLHSWAPHCLFGSVAWLASYFAPSTLHSHSLLCSFLWLTLWAIAPISTIISAGYLSHFLGSQVLPCKAAVSLFDGSAAIAGTSWPSRHCAWSLLPSQFRGLLHIIRDWVHTLGGNDWLRLRQAYLTLLQVWEYSSLR